MEYDAAVIEVAIQRANNHNGHRKLADKAYIDQNNVEAKRQYLLAVSALLGGTHFEVPQKAGTETGGVRRQQYIDLHQILRYLLMGCYNGIARCALNMNEIELALEWLEEVRVLHHNTRFTLPIPFFEWIRYSIDMPELTLERVTALAMSSDVFRILGNTGMAAERRWNTAHVNLAENHQTADAKRVLSMEKQDEVISFRHPDPKLSMELEVILPELQVFGSWKKLSLSKKGGMKARLGFTSFIWNSHLYVAGGGGESKGPWFRDIWCLNLEKLDAWRALPPYPVSKEANGVWLNWNMVVHDDKAYLVTGSPKVDFFDLRTETWGSMTTTYKRTGGDIRAGIPWWPYPNFTLYDSTQQVVGDKLYVFGGTHGHTRIGCNLFMELDLKSKVWRRLSGTHMPGPVADYLSPGPRKTPSSWVDREQERIYLIFGECDRTAASLTGEPHGADCGYAYEDFWSWDIKNEKWRLERLAGNVPCPRSEAACTYNTKLDKAVVFGGYNPALPTRFGNQHFPFSYFADTFMYCPTPPDSGFSGGTYAPKWKQVLTRGFPTYRATSQLISDPETGKIYLFGGYVNTDNVPSRKDYNSRTFGDLWQLRIDMPGGFFDEVDLEDEARTAKIGPWQRCFTCGSTGRWKKCGGSCGGHAFFCDSDCLREGWKDHKRMHACQNVKKSS